MKKETIEEAADRYENKDQYQRSKIDFIAGVKWQQERSYGEEDLKEGYEYALENVQLGRNGYEWVTFDDWFEQFKK